MDYLIESQDSDLNLTPKKYYYFDPLSNNLGKIKHLESLVGGEYVSELYGDDRVELLFKLPKSSITKSTKKFFKSKRYLRVYLDLTNPSHSEFIPTSGKKLNREYRYIKGYRFEGSEQVLVTLGPPVYDDTLSDRPYVQGFPGNDNHIIHSKSGREVTEYMVDYITYNIHDPESNDRRINICKFLN